MDERLKFLARLLEEDKMSPLCEEFGISRKTGYKIYERYKDSGVEGLTDRSRKSHRYANQLPFQLEKMILKIKQDKPTWGAPKIREVLIRKFPDIRPPARSTIHATLDKHGLVIKLKKRRSKLQGTNLSMTDTPNQI